jgi:SAM-dependent methyltransferase
LNVFQTLISKCEIISKPKVYLKRGILVRTKELSLPTLYKLPNYYDIAFTYDRDIAEEINFLRGCFLKHSKIEVKTILEPACGSGMFLVGLAEYGYKITGYDLSSLMVEFARAVITNNGVQDLASVIQGDMQSIRFDRKFDAAITLISSLSYCHTDESLSSHFLNMSETINRNGLYIVEIFFACQDIEYEKYPYETWTVNKDKMKIDISWKLGGYDSENKTRTMILNMGVKDDGTQFSFEEKHCLRLWYEDDFRSFCALGGFRLAAVYDQKFRPVPLGTPLTGELGALYCVLQKE